MYKGKTVLVVIPARGGSEGIPLKNLREVAGKTLVAHAVDVAKSLHFVDRLVVSSDHHDILDEAERGGSSIVPRPLSLSTGFVGDVKVLTHAVLCAEEFYDVDSAFDVIVMLQPTCPTRQPWEVQSAVYRLVDEGLDAVWTVSPIPLKYHARKQLIMGSNPPDYTDELDYFDHSYPPVISRQQLEPTYYRNGVAYAMTRYCLIERESISGTRWGGILLDDEHVSIDMEEDLTKAEDIICGRRQSLR